MNDKQTFGLGRSEASRNAQELVAELWLWPELTVAQWDAKIAAYRAQDEVVARKEAGLRAARGEVEAELKLLHDLTGQGLGMARQTFRRQPRKLASVEGLTVSGNSRTRIMEEARNWETAWEELDADWAPVPENTLTKFKEVRAQAETLLKAFARAKTVLRIEAKDLEILSEELDDFNMAWYASALRVFKEGTAEGNMIRSTIPTTSNPTPLPNQVIITLAESPESGTASLNYEADHATSFDILHKAPGAPDYGIVAQDRTEDWVEMKGLEAGKHTFKVIGKNSTGSGEESNPATVTVEQAKTG